jgi:hypothetical protein
MGKSPNVRRAEPLLNIGRRHVFRSTHKSNLAAADKKNTMQAFFA